MSAEARKEQAAGLLGRVLAEFGVSCRERPLRGGVLLLCRTAEGMGFAVLARPEGTLRLWRLLRWDGLRSGTGLRLVCRRPAEPGTELGVERAKDGERVLFSQQRLDLAAPEAEARVRRQVAGFLRLAARL